MNLVHKVNSLRDQPLSFWSNAANQHLPGMTSVVLVVAIGWYLAKLIWVLALPANEFDWTVKSPASSGAGPQASISSSTYRTISTAHLFGEPGAAPAPTATVDAPETRLNLKLRATIAASDGSDLAHAIIADGKGKDQVYFIDDTVAGGAVLKEIHPDRVILSRAGTLETLKLPKLSEALGRQPARQSGAPTRAAAPGSIQQAMQSSPASFTEVLRPQPYMPNGQMKGYRVYPGRDRRRFAALGLRPGDLVTEINGQTLDNLQEGMDVFRSIGNASQITVTIERNGNPMALTLDSNQIVNSEAGAQ